MKLTDFRECITFKTWSAVTRVMIHLVQTCAIVLTGSGGTLIDVQVTVGTLKSRHTKTLVATVPVLTDGSVLAGVRLALINILLTVQPLVPSCTLALVPSIKDVRTGATILASFH